METITKQPKAAEDLTRNEALIFDYIATQCRSHTNASCVASVRKISRCLNLSPATVCHAVRRLIQAELLIVSREAKGKTPPTFRINEKRKTMEMSNREIISDYMRAACKSEQIKILAQLNDCETDAIEKILTDGGINLGKRTKKTRRRNLA